MMIKGKKLPFFPPTGNAVQRRSLFYAGRTLRRRHFVLLGPDRQGCRVRGKRLPILRIELHYLQRTFDCRPLERGLPASTFRA